FRSNTLIKRIQENKPLLEHLKIPVVDRMVNEEWVRKIYLSLIADPAYKAYTETPAHTPASDLKILRQLWEQHIQKNDFLVELLRSEEHTSELQSRENLVCRLLLEKKKGTNNH